MNNRCFAIGAGLAGICIIIISSVLADVNIDPDLSLKLASTKTLEELAPKIREVWVYSLSKGTEMKSPLDYSSRSPEVVFKDDGVTEFIQALTISANRFMHSDATRDSLHFAIFVFFDKSISTIPAYLWCDVFVDGRSYVNYYSGGDSVGRYNIDIAKLILRKMNNANQVK